MSAGPRMSTPDKETPTARILVVEDSAVFREMQQLLLGQAGYAVAAHESPQTALEIAEKQHFDLVIIDYELPQMNGQQFMHALRKVQPEIAVIFVSGSLTLELAIQLSSEGVAGIFNKPANPKTLLEKVNETLARNSARDTAARVGSTNPLAPANRGKSGGLPSSTIEKAADQPAYLPRFVPGASPVFREFTHRAWKVRDFRSVLLLQGEPGSAFEPFARELMEISIFRDGPVMVCTAREFNARRIIEVLAPSLLSHDAGTLVITGVESLSDDQQKMLQNLISGRGDFLPFARRFRVVLATTGRLSQLVEQGTFDENLYYKISSLSLVVPSLREMHSDIPAIARHILASHCAGENAAAPLTLTPDALASLESQPWPENYDELTRTVLAAVPFASDGQITLEALAAGTPDLAASPAGAEMEPAPPEAEILVREEDTIRPPFPITSDLVADPVDTQSEAEPGVDSPPVATTQDNATPVARAPAGKLFARTAPAPAPAPVPPLVATSQFRPASAAYQFSQRLEACLAVADGSAAA